MASDEREKHCIHGGNPRLRLVEIIRRHVEQAEQQYRKAIAEHAGQIAASNAWDQHNADDGVGGMSENPYSSRLTHFSNSELTARNHANDMREVYELAVDTFIKQLAADEQ